MEERARGQDAPKHLRFLLQMSKQRADNSRPRHVMQKTHERHLRRLLRMAAELLFLVAKRYV